MEILLEQSSLFHNDFSNINNKVSVIKLFVLCLFCNLFKTKTTEWMWIKFKTTRSSSL